MLIKPRAKISLSIPKRNSRTEFINIRPEILELKWTRNDYRVADEMTATLTWKESGVDPRVMKYARCSLYVWDAQRYGEWEDLSADQQNRFLRFTGIATTARRNLAEVGWNVDITFQDYTCLFLAQKPFSSDGMPEWSDTLPEAWKKICKYTGFRDPRTGAIVSNVEALADRIRINPPEFASRTIGEIVPERFHAISKPGPPQNSDAWAVWLYVCSSLGLLTYIDRDECIVSSVPEHFREDNAALLVFGENILNFEETADCAITGKGVLLKSFDHLQGRVIEARYPLPGDERLKQHRAVVRRAAKEGRDPSENETSADYDEFTTYEIQTQEALNTRAEQVYEARNRQELEGKIKTREFYLQNRSGDEIDTLDLRSGEPITVGIDQYSRDVLAIIGDTQYQIRYLQSHLGCDIATAELIIDSLTDVELAAPVFHVKTLEVSLKDGEFDIDIAYHNLIVTR